jgi:pimeloyl-ACP methyl ester carboxylesterase
MTDTTSRYSVSLDDELQRLRDTARMVRTPCGVGQMVWRTWGHGEPLVLFHGGGGSWEHWVRNIATLSQHRAVWCADFPGFGDSDDAPEPTDVHAIARATADGLDVLFPLPQRVDIAGFSFGGMVGTVIAASRPGRVRQLVLVGAASLGIVRTHPRLSSWRKAADPLERRELHRKNLHILMLGSSEHDDEALALHARNVENTRFRSQRVAHSNLVRDSLASIDVEQLGAIYGSGDATGNGDMALVESIIRERQPGLRFQVIEGSGHWVQYEATEAFHEALMGLLRD